MDEAASVSQPLARVTGNLEGPRGPDVLHRVTLGPELAGVSRLRVELPRSLSCAACAGGGCDLCERRGAFTLRERDDSPRTVELTLPEFPESQAVTLRVPEEGAPGPAGLGPGHLLLTLVRGDSTSGGVTAHRSAAAEREAERLVLMKRSGFLALFLCLTFLGLLRLSGWL